MRIRRVPDGWQPPAPPDGLAGWQRPVVAEPTERPEFDWASRGAMHVGTVVHRWLQEIADAGPERFAPARIESLHPVFRRELLRLGVPSPAVGESARRVSEALIATLADDRGRWILDNVHARGAAELALNTCVSGEVRRLVIDVTFLCPDGQRWIVDYKSSSHSGGGLEQFLASEGERYRLQLRQYRDALARQYSEPIRTALYFPLLQILREVDVDTG